MERMRELPQSIRGESIPSPMVEILRQRQQVEEERRQVQAPSRQRFTSTQPPVVPINEELLSVRAHPSIHPAMKNAA